ncbi:MAG: hypothetical protein DWQ10_14365 [Calditrichaeota bacterium]|nr:MAG: hypothetical protein DWQ10_14365 [Calditrichota bacterium]
MVEKDLVQISIEGRPAFFARVEGFIPDSKPNWWHVKLLILQVPLHVVTWILRREQINGEEFTMGGTPIRIEKVIVPQEPDIEPQDTTEEKNTDTSQTDPGEQQSSSDQKARILSLGENN